ncbi:histone-lysine N-methyltransferase 2A isoform X8 [Artibeus jamaicensis]|uniref:histone-lysine N-methyltransferase 2A isoform X8 n=1 Tax=Artibeus jamaicensis TaxID=9417 RepID=UPI00235A7E0A|nr:histone-lysine N-methyltransferase 2A isoform X8 [Artibeus jamaicensis]
MAHSCRWRFPARPGTTGGGGGGGRRGLGGAPRQRVPALLLPPGPPAGGCGPGAPPSPPAVAAAAAAGSGGAGATGGAAAASALSSSASSSSSSSSSSSASSGPALLRVGPGFDAALQVSAAIGTNLRRFRAVFGESGGGGGSGELTTQIPCSWRTKGLIHDKKTEPVRLLAWSWCLNDEQFLGFGSDEEVRVRSPARSPSVKTSPRKPRGRPRSGSDRNSAILSDPSVFSPLNKSETKSGDKIKKKDSKSIEKKRGRPPTFPGVKIKITHGKDISELPKGNKEDSLKKIKRTPSATFQQATKIKKLRAGKLSPLKSKFKTGKLQIGRKGVQIVRRRGRPPSTERIKTPSGLLINSQLEKPQKVRKDKEGTPPHTKEDKTVIRQSPRRIKPVRIIPSSKRTDATIAKQLLQRAKKGAQKKIEKEAAQLQGRKVKTQVKNIRQFIMPVVSAISSRIIKTPRRFIEDEDYDPPIKIARLESTPNSRFSATSCGSSEKSSAASQHSSQMSSDSSRSSSPSVDTSTDSQASEEIQVLPEEQSDTPEAHTPLPISQSPENDSNDKRSRRYSVSERSFGSRMTKKLSALQSAPQQQTSSSPPPPLLTPPPPLQPPSSISDHTSWLMPPTIPLASPFLPASAAPMQGKRKSILREPTFRWTSLKHSRSEPQYFSSAKYAKEGLIRKPIFDNFRPPPLTPEDVGFASSFSTSGTAASARLFSPLHSGTRFDVHKRSPLLRAPRFTPSEAHSRIFESVTLPSNRASSGTPSSAVSNRKRKRKVFSPIRSEPRSPSHSMRTRSGRLSTSELSPLTTPSSVSSSLSISVSPLAASALNPTFTFPSHSLTQSGESAEKNQRPRKQSSAPAEPFSSSSPTPLFPWFSPGSQTERGRNKDKAPEELSRDRDADKNMEKDKSRERDREREKENKRESRKEKRKKGSEIQSSSALYPMGRVSKEKVVGEDVAASSSAKKATGRKKSSSLDSGTDTVSVTLGDTIAVKTKILIKKGRGNLEKTNLDLGPTAPSLEKEKTLCLSTPSSSTVKHSTSSIGSMLAQADKLPMTDKRVASLLKKAKAQLCKIEKSKSLKQTDQPKTQGQESDSSETSVRGPRIKHVCRRAAVALGRKRAVFPDDMPTLSALPWEEREKILSSMGNDDKSSIAGSEDAEPLAPPIKPIKPVTRNKAPQEPPVKKGRRSRRCGQCPGCQVPEDCGVCTNCLDKPKFGGRNIKKQCCKMRKCQNLQWMPSKAYLQKQAKAVKKKEKKSKTNEKKESKENSVVKNLVDSSQKPSPSVREDPAPKKSSGEPSLRKHVEEKNEEGNASAPGPESKQVTTPASRKSSKQVPQPAPVMPPQPPSTAPPRKEVPKTAPNDPKKKQLPPPESGPEQSKQKKVVPRPTIPVKQKPKEKEKPPPVNKQENTGTLNILSTLSNGNGSKQKIPADGVHRIRVDFKEDCEAENVWEMGGLGILTSLPITPRVVCFLCASSGHVEFVYCQVCCEPFHKFCLEENERPLEDQLENWCCRRCKFCHVCGRQHQATKQLLECNKCRNSYHPECLGPNYPTKPTKKKKVWICTKCVRCKSCGSTTPGKGWDAQWSHDFSLCHDCAKLFAKGNFCPLCDKCYDDDDYESKMMQCGKCDRWVHSKCENLSDEMYEILSNLPESVAYTCVNCTERHPAEWRLALEKELQISLKQVLTALLNSRTTSHLLRYRQAAKPPDLNPETEESIPSRSSPEGPDPPVLTEVSKQEDQQPLDLEGVKRKMDQGNYTSVLEFSDDIVKIIQAAINSDGGQPEIKKANGMVKSFFIRQMERVFPWFSVKKSRFWEPNKVSSNSGMLPNAVLPPSLDHNYAQWQEREENSHTEQPPLMKKIIPAPKPKGPGEPDSPTPLHPPTPPILSTDRSREDSPELNPPPGIEDNRQCALCLTYGDDSANDAGRLLYIGQNEWTHVNCALWSAEVFEDDDGSLKNVHMAVIRGKQLRCEFCQKPGATVGCCLTSCTSNYHFMCSRAKNCVFLDDKKVYCQRHRDLIKGEVVPENGFEVFRRVFVDFEGISLRRKFLNGLEPENIHMMIGSMTIDCLGILNDLSDCEDKLFPIGYQCSRVYWSTTDARKRCVYTCKIVECRPPVVEPDINSTVEHDENRTIAHSPTSFAETSSKESQNTAEIVSPPSPDRPPHTQTSGSCFYHVISKVPRIRTPSYSPTQRSPGCRPLPSAGSPTPTTHEIVTVGDPLLSSGLRSIGSRRHSTSSVSPQQSKLRITSPMRTGGTYSKNRVSALGTTTDVESSAKAVDHVLDPLTSNTDLRQNTSTSSNLQRTVVTMVTKTSHLDGSSSSEMKHCSASDLASNSSSVKGEKTKILSSKSSEGSSHSVAYSGIPKLSSQAHDTTSGELNSKISTFAEFSSVPFSSKEALSFPPLHLRGQRNDRDQLTDTSQSGSPSLGEGSEVKTLKLSGVSNRSCITNEHVGSSSRDRRPKGKKSYKETFKEKHSSKSFLEPGQVTAGEEGNLKSEFVDKVLTPEFMGQGLCNNNVSSDKIGDKALSIPGVPKAPSMQVEGFAKELETPRKRTVKVTLTPLKMENESQSKNTLKESSPSSPLQMESASPTEPISASESSADGPVAQQSPSNTSSQESQSNNYQNLSVQDRNLMLPDGPKPQEDGSFKRRYPRRSARARSNMFFGLTPLYGVRSYGEEDIPFYSSSTGKKRGKRSAEGQVDGADDLSTSDEDDLYYYNFTRTVISSGPEERLASHNLFREEEQCDLPKISQLDGVDDGTESDTSVTATTRKTSQIPKRNGKENGTENLKIDRPEDTGEKEHVIKSPVGHKNEPKLDNCHSVSRIKTQGQDSLEAQLSSLESSRRVHSSTPSDKNLLDTYNTELLKSDSDNNNSDDCGNILPSDIMDFVLKNTPSMQALGESPESSSSELLNLGEGLGLDSNREKDMGLFEVFSQQLPTTEPVDSSVSSSISAEEQFELPLELPSDLSVLTTRSPTVPSQNPSRLSVIPDSAEKRVTITEKPVASSEDDSALLSPGVDPAPEGHMTPDHFIQGHMDADISSPPCASVEQGHGNSQDLTRNSSTPGLQVPVSPTVPIQNQKYVPNSTDSPGPSQISNAAVQTTPPHLKPATEKLIVVNQNMQPLYVLQTLPNGVTQKIQLTSSVSSTPNVMETNTSVLGPMGSGLTLTTGLNPSLPSSQSLFPPASKGLLPVPHHQHLHSFPAATQSSFPPNMSSPSSGLLIGVQPSPDPQLLVSEGSQRTDLNTTIATPSSGLKKRPISRLQTRKNKKLAPSSTPSNIAPSDVVSNMTLINFTPSQLPNHPNLLDLGSLNTSSHRTVPNIIKRSKSGIMYFEQASLLPQSVGGTAATATGTPTVSQDTGHLTSGPVAGLPSSSSVLNVVSMQTTTAPTSSASVPGHVTLTNPRLLGTPDIGSISNLLIKASQQGLGIQDQPVALPPSSGIFPQLGTSQTPPTAAVTATSSICVLPSAQTMGIAAASPSREAEEHYQLQHVTQLLANKTGILSSQPDLDSAPGTQGSSFTQTVDAPHSMGLEQNKALSSALQASLASPGGSPPSGQQSASPSVPGPTKSKPKIKRIQLPLDKGNGKKHKVSHLRTSSSEAHIPDQEANTSSLTSVTGTPRAEAEQQDTANVEQSSQKECGKHVGQVAVLPEIQTPQNPAREQESTEPKTVEEEETNFSSPLMLWLQQEQKRKESFTDKKPKKGLIFEISSDDGFQICAESIEDAWKSLTDKVQEARSNARLKQLSFAGVNGLRMLGILHDAVLFLIEQLSGAKHCRNYKFRFHKPEEANEPPLNPHGTARAEVHLRQSAFDMFNFLASKHRQPPEYNPNDEEEEEVQLKSARRATSMDLPMPMRFRHLKKTSKEAVGVYRSPIHGRGLFCKRNIDAGEMVIEYAGNVIRSIQTDKREKYYDSKGIGCYMFRIDDSEVVDATMHGNAARFINHSCEPNCYSRVINIDGQKHIVIFAMRKIYRGEELTYDYKFPIEDASNKLPCNCGAKKCRKFLN